MVQKNFIALIFPEYDDPNNGSTSLIWKNDELLNDDQLGELLKELYTFVDFFKDEECELLFDSLNADAFTFPLKTLPSCYPARERQFRLALKGLNDWRRNRVSHANEIYLGDFESISDEIRSEIAARMILNQDESYLIAVQIPGYSNKNWTIKKESKKAVVCSLPMIIKDAFDWLSINRFPKRVYNWNPKHGEFGKGANPDNKGDKVSVLLCSRDHAREILPYAVGLKNQDFLFYFDSEYGKYMEFKADCKSEHISDDVSIRSYHSYHCDDDIPKGILKKLNML